MMAGPPGFEPGPPAPQAPITIEILERFKQFCTVDLSLSEVTAYDHLWQIKRFLKWLGDREPSTDMIRNYLAEFKDSSASTRANILKAFRRFFRDFLGRGEIVATFKLPRREFKPKIVPTREELERFYAALKRPCERAVFLITATTGLRRDEVTTLKISDVNLEMRMVVPNMESTATKRRWASFFNQEAEQALREYLNGRDVNADQRLFPWRGDRIDKWFKRASKASGVKIVPKALRDWFACEMGELGVADRYVDAFCGRVPRSVLARHYTDFGPERLKRIYDSAGLRVLDGG